MKERKKNERLICYSDTPPDKKSKGKVSRKEKVICHLDKSNDSSPTTI